MLEGMANHQARAVRERAGGLLLYAPVVRAEDFHSAIAYLVRRLDENTAPENFLRHVFDLEPGSADVDRRARSLPGRVRSAGRPLRRAPPHAGPGPGAMAATGRAAHRRADSPTSPTPTGRSRRTAPGSWRSLGRWSEHSPDAIALAIDGEIEAGATEGEKRDPSRPERVAYRFALADSREVDRALTVAGRAQPAWARAIGRGACGDPARRARPSSAAGAAT